MFDFKPSAGLMHRVAEHLNDLMQDTVVAISDDEMEKLCAALGKRFAGCIGMYAQRTRYIPAEEFPIVVGGKFTEELEEAMGGQFLIPEGEYGDQLLTELAEEFLSWVRQGDNASRFHLRAPLTKFSFTDNNVTGHVRPQDPHIVDPTFVRSTDVTFE